MAVLPPVPFRQPPMNPGGYYTPAWVDWLNKVFDRVGGHEASTNAELDAKFPVTPANLSTLSIGTFVGETRMLHTFNGTLSIPRGYLKLDGSQVNEANYNATHGAGTYVTDAVSSSSILNKYLPAMNGIYPVGANSTSEDGATAISTVGNTDHEIDLEHTHTIGDHGHQWHKSNGAAAISESYNSSGGEITLATYDGTHASQIEANSGSNGLRDDFYTSKESLSPANALTPATDAQPESVEFVFIMRVI